MKFLALLGTCLCVSGALAQAQYPYNLDGNGDGQVSLPYLLDMLSWYGTNFVVEDHLCGMPVEFKGYAYATTQIGEQCLFAENLRTATFRNGESLLLLISNADWQDAGTSEAAARSYPSQNSGAENAEVLGFLYNWHAVTDSRGLCPVGWHPPSLQEMNTLRSRCGAEECSAYVLRADSWGFNSVNFAAEPCAVRGYDGSFYSGGASFWTKTLTVCGCINNGYRHMYFSQESTTPQVILENTNGACTWMSVRCLKN